MNNNFSNEEIIAMFNLNALGFNEDEIKAIIYGASVLGVIKHRIVVLVQDALEELNPEKASFIFYEERILRILEQKVHIQEYLVDQLIRLKRTINNDIKDEYKIKAFNERIDLIIKWCNEIEDIENKCKDVGKRKLNDNKCKNINYQGKVAVYQRRNRDISDDYTISNEIAIIDDYTARKIFNKQRKKM